MNEQEVQAATSEFRRLVREGLRSRGMSIEGLAAALGYDSPLTLRMCDKGFVKFPLDRLPALANVLGTDLSVVLRLWLGECFPPLLLLLDGLNEPLLLSADELKLIRRIREHTGGTDANVVVAEGRELLAVIMG